MLLSEVLSYSRAAAQTDSNGLTDAKGIIFANEALSDFHRQLIKAGIDASQVQEAYTSATANQGTYLYPTDCLGLKVIELDYSGNASDYKTASQVDVANLPGGSFSWLRQYAPTDSPSFDDRGDWYEVFPTPTTAINQLIRLFYYLKPTAYTAVSDTVSYPENIDASILGWRIAFSYLYSLGNLTQGDAFNLKYNQRVSDYIASLGRGSQQPIQASQPDYYNSGWNL